MKIVKSLSLSNTHEVFQSFLECFKDLFIFKENLLIRLEVSRCSWENLYSHSQGNDFSVVLFNLYHKNKFREALPKKTKTDEIDALGIAHLLRTGEFDQSQLTQKLREVIQSRC